MQLRWKLFLSYLAGFALVLATAAVAFRDVGVGAASSHMHDMMMGMMGWDAMDLEEAISVGVERAVLVGLAVAGVAAVVASLVVAVWISRPLSSMADAARRIADGRYDQRVTYRPRDEIGEFSEAFNQMASKLEETETLRRELLATIAHELRTPLTNIQGYMEGLLDGVVDEQPETYEMVRREAERLTRLVGDIQRLSRLEARAERFDPAAVEPGAALVTARMNVHQRFDEKGVGLEVEAPGDLPPVWVDGDKLQQVLLNLLTNALRFTPAGGRVTLTASRTGNAVAFAVTDTGIGIAPEDLPHVFERFYRAEKSRSMAGGGAGIGLAVARNIVEQSGGSIGVESALGEGTTVRFTLPVADRRA